MLNGTQFDILVVDDNAMNLGVLAGILRERDYRVRVATDGHRGLEAARRVRPDLILLDISMPGMDGFEVCDLLKADANLAQVPVIFISAHDEPLDKVKAFQVGGTDYVQKPFQASEVIARVEHHLKLAALQSALEARNRELEEAKGQLEELDRMKARFAAMLVHDLRNPLGGLSMSLELMQAGESFDPALLDRAQGEVKRCLTFLHELLEVYRGESKGLELRLEPVEPAALLAESAEAFRATAQAQGVALITEWPEALPPIHADAAKLERVLANLLANALKFTPPGGRIHLGADAFEGEGVDAGTHWLRLWVEDTGRGIPADQVPFVFDPYRQVLAKDSARGAGLGLAIVSSLVAAHHGRITVQSQEGVGTRFTVLIPCPAPANLSELST